METGSKNFTPNITVSDMVQGTSSPNFVKTTNRIHYLEGKKFNLEDTSTGSLMKITKKYGLCMDV